MESGRRGSSLNCGRELVVLPVGLVPGLFDVFVQQVVVQLVVDGLAAVARVEAGGREGEQGDGRVGRAPDVALGVVAGGRVHGPVGRIVDHGPGARELAGRAGSAVGHGVGLGQPGQALDLVGDLPLGEASSLSVLSR